MGFRFYRRFRLFPDVRLNFSRSGISTSIGRRGAWFTVGPRGTRETVGLPGTRLFYTRTQPPHHANAAPAPPQASNVLSRVILYGALLVLAFATFVISRL
jgi:hypothetical protein